MSALDQLRPFDVGGRVRMVVESPRGSSLKFMYDPESAAITVARRLPIGLSYPFDWGFVPGTRGEDGDPVDALALHDAATYPGVILACRAIGMVLVRQGTRKQQSNHRLVLIPAWDERQRALAKPADLPRRLRQEIEQFFLSAAYFTGKDPTILGWRGRDAALKHINASKKEQ